MTRSTTLAGDAASIEFHYRVRGSTAGENATAEVVVAGDGAREQVVELSGAGDGTDGWVTDAVDVSRFGGEAVTVRLRTVGNATLEADYVGFVVDTSGDDIPDAVARMDLEMPTGPPAVWGTSLGIDPAVVDSSGDGLADAEQVDIDWSLDEKSDNWYLAAEVVAADARPGSRDTDRDGVTDYEELAVWETDPLLLDTDGDGYIDQTDPLPTTDSSPPSTTIVEANTERIVIEVEDDSEIQDVTVEAVYPKMNRLPLGDASLRDVFATEQFTPERTVREDGTIRFFIPIEKGGPMNNDPIAYSINVTDAAGNKVSHVVSSDGESAEGSVLVGSRMKVAGGPGYASVAAGLGLTTLASELAPLVSSPHTLGTLLLLVAAATLLAVLAKYVDLTPATSPRPLNKRTIKDGRWSSTPPSTAEQYPVAGEIVTLPEGAVYHETGYLRGYGLEYVITVEGVTEADVRHAIENPVTVVRDDGEIGHIIGRALSDEELIILSIIGGTIIAANTIEDPGRLDDGTEECREIGYTDNQIEHASQKDHIDGAKAKDAVTKPDAIGFGDKAIYYAKEIPKAGWFVIIVRHRSAVQSGFVRSVMKSGGLKYWFGTSLINKETGTLFLTLEALKTYMDNKGSVENKDENWDDNPGNNRC